MNSVLVLLSITISCCLIVGFLCKSKSIKTKRRLIAKLDLDAVRNKAMKRHDWSAETANVLQEQYRDFLILIAENKGLVLSPWSNELDLFWHEHILDTKKYEKDCKKIFGRIIRHDPHIENDSQRHTEIKTQTIRLREDQVRKNESVKSDSSAQSDSTWIGSIFGCGASSGSENHSNNSGNDSHSGHGSSGHSSSHSDGGSHSSCGGHSCGGHSCGGGSCSSCGGS